MSRRLLYLMLAVALAIAGGFFASPAHAQDAAPDLDDARWASLSVRPYNTYTVTYERTTAPRCPADAVCPAVAIAETVEAVVMNGRLFSATNVETGEPALTGLTIDAWFDEIDNAANAGALGDGALNELYGYPESYTLDFPDEAIFMETLDFTWGAVRDYQIEQYERAVATWEENEPPAYQFEYQLTCGICVPPPEVIITVRNGEVVEIDTVDGSDIPIPDYLSVTIDDLLERAGESLRSPRTNDNAWFGFRYGEPVSFSGQPSDPLIADGQFSFEASNLRSLDPWPEVQAALDEARANFTATTYTITYRVSCFCPNRNPITVEVVDGQIVSVEGAELRQALTVPLMFEAIQAAINADVDRVTASFDPVTGVPTNYSVDQSFQIADEEYSVEITSFVEGGGPELDCSGLGHGAASAALSGRMEFVELPDRDMVEVAVGATTGRNTYTVDPSSYAEFCVTVENPGVYRLDASVMGPARNSDSFFVEIDGDLDVWHLPRSRTFIPATARDTDGVREFRLEAGEHRVRFYLRETDSLVRDFLLVRVGALTTSVASCSSTVGQNADAGAVANGAFELSTFGDGMPAFDIPDNVRNRYRLDREHYAEFCVTAPAGLYGLSARVLAADGNSNSFWVQVDDGEPILWHIRVAPSFVDNEVPMEPVRLDGEHRIRLYHREDTPVGAVTLQPVVR